MKTIEEKAKAYDKALQIARKINNGEGVTAPSDWTICETIFPELKESEDEKIRKWIITQLELKSDVNNPHDLELMILKSIAWLEKQGDKDKLIKELDAYKVKYMQEIFNQQLKKKSEQKPKNVSLWKHWKGGGVAGGIKGEQIFLIKNGNTYSISSCLGFECDYIELSELDGHQ